MYRVTPAELFSRPSVSRCQKLVHTQSAEDHPVPAESPPVPLLYCHEHPTTMPHHTHTQVYLTYVGRGTWKQQNFTAKPLLAALAALPSLLPPAGLEITGTCSFTQWGQCTVHLTGVVGHWYVCSVGIISTGTCTSCKVHYQLT